ncbi:helix-turn-helix transcriptional regulator [Streptomyces fuscichromogenes]|uniref:helix-turn-helix domain-containing protein n=1 Tax=Streptomyces fuscichromogenes TaxID=1324013 RepID=UPI00380F845D
MPTGSDPSLNRRKLRVALRTAREKKGLAQREAASELDWSLSKVIRIEAGQVSLSVTDLQALLRLYEVTDDAVVQDLEQAARGSKGQSWWFPYNEIIAPPFAQFLGYESAADSIRTYHPTLVPGLLQTTDYMNALFEASPAATPAQQNIDLRTARQERVFADGGPKVSVIVDESALRRLVGGAGTMRQQLEHIKRLAAERRIALRVLLLDAGAHDSLENAFVLLGFHDDDDVLYVAGPGGVLTNRDNLPMVARYQECFEDLTDKALSEEESAALLDELLDQLNSP